MVAVDIHPDKMIKKTALPKAPYLFMMQFSDLRILQFFKFRKLEFLCDGAKLESILAHPEHQNHLRFFLMLYSLPTTSLHVDVLIVK